MQFAVAKLQADGEAVRAATEPSLGRVKADGLACVVTVSTTEMPVSRPLAVIVCQRAGHAGDIAATKCIRGRMGLPR